MARHDTILISFTFGAKRIENIPFPAACEIARKYLDDEQSAYVTLVTQINEDSWFASYWSDVFGGASALSEDDWNQPRVALYRARNAYDAGMDHIATRSLEEGVRGFNAVHGKLYEYREALGRGGSRAKASLEITCMVLGAVFSAGVGMAGASYLGGSLISTGLTLAEQLAYNSSMVSNGLQQKYDISEIIMQTGASFVSSLIAGKLVECFAGFLAKRLFLKMAGAKVPDGLKYVKEIMMWAKQSGIKPLLSDSVSSGKEFVANYLASFASDRLLGIVTSVAHVCKGEMMSMSDFIRQVADKVADEVFLRSDLQAAPGNRSDAPRMSHGARGGW